LLHSTVYVSKYFAYGSAMADGGMV
jgi:hypothetical protein